MKIRYLFFYLSIVFSPLGYFLQAAEGHQRKRRRVEKQIRCDHCWHSFDDEEAAVKHEQVFHSVGGGDESYRCFCCRTSFATPFIRSQHQGTCCIVPDEGVMRESVLAGMSEERRREAQSLEVVCRTIGSGDDAGLRETIQKLMVQADQQQQFYAAETRRLQASIAVLTERLEKLQRGDTRRKAIAFSDDEDDVPSRERQGATKESNFQRRVTFASDVVSSQQAAAPAKPKGTFPTYTCKNCNKKMLRNDGSMPRQLELMWQQIYQQHREGSCCVSVQYVMKPSALAHCDGCGTDLTPDTVKNHDFTLCGLFPLEGSPQAASLPRFEPTSNCEHCGRVLVNGSRNPKLNVMWQVIREQHTQRNCCVRLQMKDVPYLVAHCDVCKKVLAPQNFAQHSSADCAARTHGVASAPAPRAPSIQPECSSFSFASLRPQPDLRGFSSAVASPPIQQPFPRLKKRFPCQCPGCGKQIGHQNILAEHQADNHEIHFIPNRTGHSHFCSVCNKEVSSEKDIAQHQGEKCAAPKTSPLGRTVVTVGPVPLLSPPPFPLRTHSATNIVPPPPLLAPADVLDSMEEGLRGEVLSQIDEMIKDLEAAGKKT